MTSSGREYRARQHHAANIGAPPRNPHYGRYWRYIVNPLELDASMSGRLWRRTARRQDISWRSSSCSSSPLEGEEHENDLEELSCRRRRLAQRQHQPVGPVEERSGADHVDDG